MILWCRHCDSVDEVRLVARPARDEVHAYSLEPATHVLGHTPGASLADQPHECLVGDVLGDLLVTSEPIQAPAERGPVLLVGSGQSVVQLLIEDQRAIGNAPPLG